MSINNTLLSVAQLTHSLNADKLQEMARIAEYSERYDDMCSIVTKLVKLRFKEKQDLTANERNLWSVAFKNVVGRKRAAWRVLNGYRGFENNNTVSIEESLQTYQAMIKTELQKACKHTLDLLINYLLKTVEGNHSEVEVFYLKAIGDYYRYLAEIELDGSGDNDNGDKSRIYYQKALVIADANLHPTHPTRLGLALNFSVCYYEILKDSEKACDLAKRSFDDAIEKLDCIGDDCYRDSTLIMQLLRDNLHMWTSDNTDQ